MDFMLMIRISDAFKAAAFPAKGLYLIPAGPEGLLLISLKPCRNP